MPEPLPQLARLGRADRIAFPGGQRSRHRFTVRYARPLPPQRVLPVQAEVVDNPIQPGAKARLTAKPRERLPGADERLLGHIAGLVRISQEAQGEGIGRPLIGLHQDRKGLLVPALTAPDQRGLIRPRRNRRYPVRASVLLRHRSLHLGSAARGPCGRATLCPLDCLRPKRFQAPLPPHCTLTPPKPVGRSTLRPSLCEAWVPYLSSPPRHCGFRRNDGAGSCRRTPPLHMVERGTGGEAPAATTRYSP